jgi:methionyl-tRNA formyltransferase
MKIGYFADGPWSHVAIEKIAADKNLQISFIVPRYDSKDPILKKWSKKLNVPFLIAKNVNDISFLKSIKKYDADLFISMSYNQILKKDILSIPPKGFINCHAGAIPFYRGRNPLNWALINGEKKYGITVHFVDEGIDTGDIIIQKKYPIQINDTYKILLDHAVYECASVLFDSIKKIQNNSVIRIKQTDIHSVGTYFGRRIIGDEIIDFNQSSERVHNFIRAISEPGPSARAFIDDKELAIHRAELIDNAPEYIATVGEVIGSFPEGIAVKTKNSSILVTNVSEVNNNEVGHSFTPNFKIGTRFRIS